MKTTRETKKPALKHMTLKLNIHEGARYDEADLVEVLKKISFDLININLSTKKKNVGIQSMGYTSVGFVNGFNAEDCTFKVAVFENHVEAITVLGEVGITPRVFSKDGSVIKVIGLDVEPISK